VRDLRNACWNLSGLSGTCVARDCGCELGGFVQEWRPWVFCMVEEGLYAVAETLSTASRTAGVILQAQW
jgi:hypothetical protein